MGKRIVIGFIIIGLMAGGVYFANLTREVRNALYASKAEVGAREASLNKAQEEKMRLEKELTLRQADLQKERKTVVTLREASTRYASDILKLRETISDLETQVSEMGQKNAYKVRLLEKEKESFAVNLRSATMRYDDKILKLRAAISDMKASAAKIDKKYADKIRALETTNNEMAKKLKKTASALANERNAKSELEKMITGTSAQAEEVRQALVMTKASLSEMGEKHRATRAWAQKERLRAKKLESSLEELRQKFSERELLLRQTKGMLQIDIVNRVLFDVGSAEIKEDGRTTLDKLVSFLKEQSERVIRVEGHTDNQPISGALARRYPTNWELSSARAISVVRYLESKGVPSERLSATGYSFHREETSNETAEGRARNRRIVLLLSRLKR